MVFPCFYWIRNMVLIFLSMYLSKKQPVEGGWEPSETLKSVIISLCDFIFAGWTQLLSAFHTTCSSHHKMLCSLFNSILPQSPPHDIICNAGVFLWCETPDCVFLYWCLSELQLCISVCDDSLTLLPSYMTWLLTVPTMSPPVTWWTTPACSVESPWCQQVPWDWRDR